MKKIIALISTVTLIGVALFTSCNKNEILSTIEQYSDEEILANIKFVGQGGTDMEDVAPERRNPVFETDLVIRGQFGRKSMDCKGFGICWIEIDQGAAFLGRSIPENQFMLPYKEGMLDNGFEMLLAEIPNINMANVKLIIDEDIDIYDNNNNNARVFTVKANAYSYQKNMGNAGGFRLETTNIEQSLLP